MATANIYGFPNSKASSPRNGFGLSHDTLFNSPAGLLLPCLSMDIKAGDTVKLSAKNLTRTNAVQTSAYAGFDEKVDFFFVPYRLLWSGYGQWRLGTTQPRSTTSLLDIPRLKQHPFCKWTDVYQALYNADLHTTSIPMLGMYFPFALRMLDLLNYGLPRVSGITSVVVPRRTDGEKSEFWQGLKRHFQNLADNYVCNYFRLAAYQCIYMSAYRNEDYEPLDPSYYNVDSLFIGKSTSSSNAVQATVPTDGSYGDFVANQSTPFTLFHGFTTEESVLTANKNRLTLKKLFTPRLKNLRKDLFTTIKPASGILPYGGTTGSYDSTNVVIPPTSGSSFKDPMPGGFEPVLDGNGTSLPVSITMNDIRRLSAIDKFSRLAIYADKDYSSLYESLFGVKVDEPDVPRYLGTFSSDIKITEIVATSAGSDGASGDDAKTSVLGELAGKGLGQGQSHVFDATFKEDGIIMGIHYIMPYVYYNPYKFDPFVVKSTKYDYYYPSFDGLGLSPVFLGERCFYGSSTTSSVNYSSILGYNTRYHEYKQAVSTVHGTFAPDQPESDWSLTINNEVASSSPSYLFKVDPRCTDSIFGVAWNSSPVTDPFKCFFSFNVTKVSNMEAIGVPNT